MSLIFSPSLPLRFVFFSSWVLTVFKFFKVDIPHDYPFSYWTWRPPNLPVVDCLIFFKQTLIMGGLMEYHDCPSLADLRPTVLFFLLHLLFPLKTTPTFKRPTPKLTRLLYHPKQKPRRGGVLWQINTNRQAFYRSIFKNGRHLGFGVVIVSWSMFSTVSLILLKTQTLSSGQHGDMAEYVSWLFL